MEILEERKEKYTDVIKRANDSLEDVKHIDEKMEGISFRDTETLWGEMKNQPIMALENVKGYIKGFDLQEKSAEVLRAAEIAIDKTSEYWRVQSNFYYHLLSKTMMDPYYHFRGDGKNEFLTKEGVEFLIRTKGFCFADRNSLNNGPNYQFYSFTQEFLNSKYLPKELRFDLDKQTDLMDIYNHAKELKENFKLNPDEFGGLLGTMVGLGLAADKSLLNDIVARNFLQKISEIDEIDNHLFDLNFGSAIYNESSYNSLTEEQEKLFKELIIKSNNLNFPNITRTLVTEGPMKYNPPKEVLRLPDLYGNLMKESEHHFTVEENRNTGNHNIRETICPVNGEQAFYIIENNVINSKDPVDALLRLSSNPESMKTCVMLGNWDIYNYCMGYQTPVDHVEKFLACTLVAFPELKKIELPLNKDVNKDEIIEAYLDVGGEMEKVQEIEEILEESFGN